MRNLHSLSAKQLLGVSSPESLFSRVSNDAKQEYRALALTWHPDNSSMTEAREVFQHIVALYRAAQQKVLDGTWDEPYEKVEHETPGVKRVFCSELNIVFAIEYLTVRPFELGRMYIGDHSVTFEVENEFQDLFLNGRRRIRNLQFKDESMAVEMAKFLPQIEHVYKTEKFSYLQVRKTPDQLLLADVLRHFSNRIEPIEHIGWILNILLHLSCYLEWSGLTHNDISPDTFFISPLRHSGMLLGGWWYATPVDDDLLALPERSLNFIPPDIIVNRKADLRADLELIKTVGREILGDQIGSSLAFDADLPESIPAWLTLPSSRKAVDNYRTWKHEVLEECFGTARFVEMSLDSRELYKEI